MTTFTMRLSVGVDKSNLSSWGLGDPAVGCYEIEKSTVASLQRKYMALTGSSSPKPNHKTVEGVLISNF